MSMWLWRTAFIRARLLHRSNHVKHRGPRVLVGTSIKSTNRGYRGLHRHPKRRRAVDPYDPHGVGAHLDARPDTFCERQRQGREVAEKRRTLAGRRIVNMEDARVRVL